jgi:glycosyltransferase involved in cell wall biosynthesis
MTRHAVAVILPAYNEAATVAAVMDHFHASLPDAFLCVIDNASTDGTGRIARDQLQVLGAKGVVLLETARGKANAIRRAFLEIDADIYLMADADLTYPADEAHKLVDPIANGEADMVVGDRISAGHYAAENKRPGHEFGNTLVASIINRLYGSSLDDVLSGYRAFNRRFIKNYPVLVRGFELETDLTLHALEMRHRVLEVPITYRDRPEGSTSKLNTTRDGMRVLTAIFQIFRHYRPMAFFSAAAIVLGIAGLVAGVGPVADYLQYRFVYRVPLAVLAVGLELSALFSLSTGLVLSTIVRGQRAWAERALLAEGPCKV